MSLQLEERQGVRLAIEGCGHGTLHAIYASIAEACKQKRWPGIDLLIIDGDFQAVRNAYDLNCVSMPAKYREMCDFHEYYSGQRTAPCLTLFVGGNHEASNHLFELYYGGWVAPNIYYVGAASLLRIGPLRIAALSGIWKGYNFRKPHHERLPYNETDMKSIYHVRELDVRKLVQIQTQIDIGISHDWPKGVEWKGNWKQLFRFKPHFEKDAKNSQLGSVAGQQVMDWLRPRWWFSAHLHCKYAAIVGYGEKDPSQQSLPSTDATAVPLKNEDEIDLDGDNDAEDDLATAAAWNGGQEAQLDSEATWPGPTAVQSNANGNVSTDADEVDLDLEKDGSETTSGVLGQAFAGMDANASGAVNGPSLSSEEARAALPESFRRPAAPEQPVHPSGISNKNTHFLALDKCLPGRRFLQLMTIPTESDIETMRPLKLEYDREWLSITRAFAIDEPLVLGDPNAPLPRARSQQEYGDAIDKRRMWVDEHISDADLVVPENFDITAPVYDGGNWNLPQYSEVLEHPNPQTTRFCEMLDIPNPFNIGEDERLSRIAAGPKPDPHAERFSRGEGRGGFRHGRGRGDGRGRARGGGRGRGRFAAR